MILQTSPNSSTLDHLVGLALAAFAGNREDELDKIISNVREGEEVGFMMRLNSLFKGDASESDFHVVGTLRYLTRSMRFGRYVSQKPYLREQAVFFTNTDDLKTRVSLSLMELGSSCLCSVDYTILAFDQTGKKLFEKDGVIKPRETLTFRLERLLKEFGVSASCGTFYIRTVNREMGSLRVYACWYNSKGMTTTHEKCAFRNAGNLSIFATVLATASHETYLLIPNISDEEVKFKIQLVNHHKVYHPQVLNVGLKGRAAAMIPITKYFSDAEKFLEGRSGTAYLLADPAGKAMYYYFIYDKRRGSWQIQHT